MGRAWIESNLSGANGVLYSYFPKSRISTETLEESTLVYHAGERVTELSLEEKSILLYM
jgi:hypothetical protein